MKQLGIILTGTVKTSVVGGNFTPDERMQMYTDTLRYYAHVIGKAYPIIFLENSNADLTPWKDEFGDMLNLEILQFRPDNPSASIGFDSTRGKGYNEFLMLKKGVLASVLLKKCDYFLKITGRYAMVNICDMLCEIEKRATNDIVLMDDLKDTKFYEMLGIQRCASHWGDVRFFVAKIEFFINEMIEAYMEMNDYADNQWAEHYMVRLSRKYRRDPRFIWRFRHQVRFSGVSGTLTSEQLAEGKGRQDSITNKFKGGVRHLMRVLFPKWYI